MTYHFHWCKEHRKPKPLETVIFCPGCALEAVEIADRYDKFLAHMEEIFPEAGDRTELLGTAAQAKLDLDKAKRLLRDSMDLLEARQIEEAEIRKLLVPIAEAAGIIESKAHSMGYLVKVLAPLLVEAQKKAAERGFYKDLYEKACNGTLMQSQADTIKALRVEVERLDKGWTAASRTILKMESERHNSAWSRPEDWETLLAEAQVKAHGMGQEQGARDERERIITLLEMDRPANLLDCPYNADWKDGALRSALSPQASADTAEQEP